MNSRRQEATDRVQPPVTPATRWWRKLGILCLLCPFLATTAIAWPPQKSAVPTGFPSLKPPPAHKPPPPLPAPPPPKSPVFTSLVNFDGTNGGYPIGPLTLGTHGNLYGATAFGGTMFSGNIFKLTADGTLTTLYNFCSEANCTDGIVPPGGLVLGTDRNFYGTTAVGGGALGFGTVFRITPSGVLTTLYNWCSQPNCADGTYEALSGNTLIQAADGNFYGTNNAGGTGTGGGSCFFGDFGCGTVFKLTPGGTLTTLYNWCSEPNCTDGQFPVGALVQGADENFYGTTNYGGANGAGTIFRITPGGTLTTLYSFCSQPNCADGGYPGTGLLQASDNDLAGPPAPLRPPRNPRMATLYGTTGSGGANGAGTVFKLTPDGTLTTLYDFCADGSPCTDGVSPSALVLGSDGNFYGTSTYSGPTGGEGTVFQLTPKGALTTLYGLCTQVKCTDGYGPMTMTQGIDGSFYGTMSAGGTTQNGTIFNLDIGLHKPGKW